MKIKTHEFKVIIPEQTDNGCGETGRYVVSKTLLTIPEMLLNQQAAVEMFPDGVCGIDECCCRIYAQGNSWLVLGDVRSVCFTNDVIVAHY